MCVSEDVITIGHSSCHSLSGHGVAGAKSVTGCDAARHAWDMLLRVPAQRRGSDGNLDST